MTHIILGGGVSGLSAAYYLSKTFINKIKLYESSNRVGGWIKSVKSNNGALFELGPRTLRARDEASLNTLELIEEIGLSKSVKAVSVKTIIAKSRLIYFENKLVGAPLGFVSFIKGTPLGKPLILGFLKDISTPKLKVDDDSIYNFVARRFGKDYAENIISPLVCGIFGGDAKEISVKSFMSGLFEKEQKYGSVIFGLFLSKLQKKKKNHTNLNLIKKTKNWSVWSLENGLETLPIGLYNYLNKKNNVEIFLEKKCSNIEFKKGEVILTINGNIEKGDHLYSSLPCKQLGKLIGDEHSFLKSELLSVPFVNIAVVNLEYEYDVLEEESFGVLVPPNQKLPILGIVFDSCIFEQDGKTVLTVMMGGRWFEQYFGTNPDKDTLLQVAIKHVKLILNVDEKPINSLVTVLEDAIPQYVIGHSKRVEGIREYIKKNKLPLTLIGNSFDGVGVNDAILSARKNVKNTIEEVNLKNVNSDSVN